MEEFSSSDMHSGASRRVILSALAFVAGFTVVFVALGASASAIGQAVQEHM